MEVESQKYPFDFDLLCKGDVIAAEVIEEIVRLPRSHKNYSLKLLNLKEQIERELEARGRPVNVKCEKDSLRILTDEEARPYTECLFRSAQRAIRKSHQRACIIDRSNLSQEQQSLLDRQLMIQGAKLAALSKAGSKLTVEPHRRTAPSISGPSLDSGKGSSTGL